MERFFAVRIVLAEPDRSSCKTEPEANLREPVALRGAHVKENLALDNS